MILTKLLAFITILLFIFGACFGFPRWHLNSELFADKPELCYCNDGRRVGEKLYYSDCVSRAGEDCGSTPDGFTCCYFS